MSAPVTFHFRLWAYIAAVLAAGACSPPQLDTGYYPATEINIPGLLRQKNCASFPGGDFLTTWHTECDDINDYRYFTSDRKAYDGKVQMAYFSSVLHCSLTCTGKLKNGCKYGIWTFVSAPNDIEIKGNFGTFVNPDGMLRPSFCTGRWTIHNRRDRIYYTVLFDDKKEEAILDKAIYRDRDSIFTRQALMNPSREINVSPLANGGITLNYDTLPDFEKQTLESCITRFPENSLHYRAGNFTIMMSGGSLTYMSYYMDSLGSRVDLWYDSTTHRLDRVVVGEDSDNRQQYFADKNKPRATSVVRYEENGTPVRLEKKQYWADNAEWMIQTAASYCPAAVPERINSVASP